MQSRLIGWDEGGCMMIEQPVRGGSGVQLNKDLAVVGRGMYEGRVIGFKSTVLFQIVQPFRILFLSYPDQIEKINLRKSDRINATIDVLLSARKQSLAELKANEEAPRGTIKNISTGGCSISCPFRFEVNVPIFVSGELPNGKTIDNVMGFVKNVTRDQNENIYGVQFEERAGSMEGLKEFIMLAAKIVGGDMQNHP